MNELLNTLSKAKWKKFGTARRAGVLAPLFSVYSKKSAGIGDFADLELLIDWCAGTGNSILQLLPMNEVGAIFCPYDAVSSFALECSYISLNKASAGDLRKRFPAGEAHVDYGVKKAKIDALRDAYSSGKLADSPSFKKFIKANNYWLDDFALFKALKDDQDGRPWYEWDDAYKGRDTAALKSFADLHADELAFEKWAQWIAYEQFRDAKDYAASKGIKLCGDLPILMSKDSADVWAHPEFFKLEFAAGAPPDMYCAKGQRWGSPTYDWERIAADKFRYLKAKLEYAENFYDMLRIDHVVGLFRIWSIPENEPLENEGLNGSFDPRDEKEWKAHGRRILSVMNGSTKMLLLAEDLGMIPKSCPEQLKRFGIPGNDVQRWTKDWAVSHDFLDPKKYRLDSISMLSTHDTTNWPAWWKYEAGTVDEALFIRKCRERGIDYGYVKDRLFDPSRSKNGRLRWLEAVGSVEMLVSVLGKRQEEVKDFIELYQNTYLEKEKLWKHLKLSGRMCEEPDPEITAAALQVTLRSRSVFCVNTLIDYCYLGMIFKGDPYQYSINRPGTVNDKNWSLVMPISLEDLAKNKVSAKVKSIIEAAPCRRNLK